MNTVTISIIIYLSEKNMYRALKQVKIQVVIIVIGNKENIQEFKISCENLTEAIKDDTIHLSNYRDDFNANKIEFLI